MATSFDFDKLRDKGFYRPDKPGEDLYKISSGAEVFFWHNGALYKSTGYRGPNARKKRNCVQYVDDGRNEYIPMRYVSIDPDSLRLPAPFPERPPEQRRKVLA